MANLKKKKEYFHTSIHDIKIGDYLDTSKKMNSVYKPYLKALDNSYFDLWIYMNCVYNNINGNKSNNREVTQIIKRASEVITEQTRIKGFKSKSRMNSLYLFDEYQKSKEFGEKWFFENNEDNKKFYIYNIELDDEDDIEKFDYSYYDQTYAEVEKAFLDTTFPEANKHFSNAVLNAFYYFAHSNDGDNTIEFLTSNNNAKIIGKTEIKRESSNTGDK